MSVIWVTSSAWLSRAEIKVTDRLSKIAPVMEKAPQNNVRKTSVSLSAVTQQPKDFGPVWRTAHAIKNAERTSVLQDALLLLAQKSASVWINAELMT